MDLSYTPWAPQVGDVCYVVTPRGGRGSSKPARVEKTAVKRVLKSLFETESGTTFTIPQKGAPESYSERGTNTSYSLHPTCYSAHNPKIADFVAKDVAYRAHLNVDKRYSEWQKNPTSQSASELLTALTQWTSIANIGLTHAA